MGNNCNLIDCRNSEYYEDDVTNSDGNLIHRTSGSGGYYETPATQAEVKQESSENTQANLYAFPSSSPAFSYENNQPSEIPYIQNSSEMQNLERAMVMSKIHFSLELFLGTFYLSMSVKKPALILKLKRNWFSRRAIRILLNGHLLICFGVVNLESWWW